MAQFPRVIQPTWNKDVGIGQDFVGGRLKCLCWQYIRRRPATEEVDGALLELIGWRFWGRHPEGRERSLVLKTSTWGNARSATIFKMSGEFATCKHWVSQRPQRDIVSSHGQRSWGFCIGRLKPRTAVVRRSDSGSGEGPLSGFRRKIWRRW